MQEKEYTANRKYGECYSESTDDRHTDKSKPEDHDRVRRCLSSATAEDMSAGVSNGKHVSAGNSDACYRRRRMPAFSPISGLSTDGLGKVESASANFDGVTECASVTAKRRHLQSSSVGEKFGHVLRAGHTNMKTTMNIKSLVIRIVLKTKQIFEDISCCVRYIFSSEI